MYVMPFASLYSPFSRLTFQVCPFPGKPVSVGESGKNDHGKVGDKAELREELGKVVV